MIKGALFDMDGVLVDNMRVHAQAFAVFYERHGITEAERKDVLTEFSGLGNDEIMQRLFPPEQLARLGGWQALGDEKEAIYRELYAPTIRPAAGLLDFLEALRSAGIRCAVGSSAGADNIAFVFDRCGFAPYFDAVIGSGNVTRCKPDPEIYLKAAAALGVAPQACVVFEDARAGIEAGRRAGMKVVAVATTLPREELERTTAACVIDDFTQIGVERLRTL